MWLLFKYSCFKVSHWNFISSSSFNALLKFCPAIATQTTTINFWFSKILLSDLYRWLCISFDTKEQFTNFNGELHMFVEWFNKSKLLQSHLQTDIWSSLSWTICPSRSRLTTSTTLSMTLHHLKMINNYYSVLKIKK